MAAPDYHAIDTRRWELAQKVPLKALENLAASVEKVNKEKREFMLRLQELMNGCGKMKQSVHVVEHGDASIKEACIENRMVWLVDGKYHVNTGEAIKITWSMRTAANLVFESLTLEGDLLEVEAITWHPQADGLTGMVYFAVSKREKAPANTDENTGEPTSREQTVNLLLDQLMVTTVEIREINTRDGLVNRAKLDKLEKEAGKLRRALVVLLGE